MADSTAFALGVGALRGIAWSRVTYHERPPAQHLGSHYKAVDSAFQPKIQAPANACTNCEYPWETFTYRNGASDPPIMEFGTNPLVTGKLPLFQTAAGVTESSRRFTTAAITALNLANTEAVGSRENTTGSIRGLVGATGVLFTAGTAFLKGAFSVASNGQIDYAAATGLASETAATAARAFVATEGSKGTVYSIRSGLLVKQDVASALLQSPTGTVTTLTKRLPTEPKAMAWDAVTRSVYLLDVVNSGIYNKRMRLLRIAESGVSDELWASPATAPTAMPVRYYLQTTAQGELLVSVSLPSGTSTPSEWALLDASGVAQFAGRWTARLESSPLLHDVALLAPIGRANPTSATGPLTFIRLERNLMKPGVCDTSWLKNFVPSTPCGAAWDGTTPTDAQPLARCSRP